MDVSPNLTEPMTNAKKKYARMIADSICENAITLVRDKYNLLPLDIKKDKNILVVGVAPVARKGGDHSLTKLRKFSETLRQKGFNVKFQHNILYETQGWEDSSPKQYDRILIVIDRHVHAPFGPLGLWDDEAQTAWGVNAMPKDKIIVINLGNPYLVNEYFERVNTCVNAYSNTEVMHKALVKAITGETEMNGVSPVRLEMNNRIVVTKEFKGDR